MTSQQAKKLAQAGLSEKRFYHSCCVADSAAQLAQRYGADIERAMTAGYLHDILKERESADLLQMISGSDIIDVDEASRCPAVLHAYAAGEYLEKSLGLDRELADAVRYHSTGRGCMTKMDMIIFLADYISADRKFRGVDEVRELCESSMEQAIFKALQNQIIHLTKLGRYIDLNSVRAFNALCGLFPEKEIM